MTAIRRARADEADAIAELIRSSKYDAMPWLAVPHTIEEDRCWVAGVLLPEQDVRVVDLDGRIAAVVATTPGRLEQLYVATDAQGHGLGRLLLDDAKERHPGGLELWAFQRNVRARRFYEAAGFRVVRTTEGDNEEREPDVLYRWDGVARHAR